MHKTTKKSTLFLHFVVAFLYLNIFGLTNSEGIESTDNDSATPYFEKLRYCGTLKPLRGNYIITEAMVSWGKWIKGPDNLNEIGSPVNQTIAEGTEYQFCTAGRPFIPIGPNGHIVIVEKTPNAIASNQSIKIVWNFPIVGSFEQIASYSIEFYNISTYKLPVMDCHSYLYAFQKWKK